MNKKGHLWITEHSMNRNLADGFKGYRFWVRLGCILPDFLYHTYLVGHTWEASFERTVRRIVDLEKWGTMNWYSCLWLGYQLHYVEDYFTYPHNENYKGNLKEHVVYERNLTQYFYREKSKAEDRGIFSKGIYSAEQLELSLQELHKEYKEQAQGMENDEIYIEKAVQQVLEYYAVVFRQNKLFLEKARLETLRFAESAMHLSGYQEV